MHYDERATEVVEIVLRFLMGIVVGILLVPVGVLTWFQFGHVPVAVADPPLPDEHAFTSAPLHARIHKEMAADPPIQPDEANLVAGAHIYSDHCAVCHGFYGKPSDIGRNIYPDAPPLWQKHPNSDVVGVSDDPPGETYWKVANGIRLSGMPSYKPVLTDTQMWQVSLLLANADKPLPPDALSIVRGNAPAAPSPAAPAAGPGPAAHQ
jgi:thiosulfate dehydrogenase